MPKIRVMVVDDSVVIRKLISTVIDKQEDMEVSCTAANGSIALRKMEHVQSDIITMDINMPEFDGIEVVRRIRQEKFTIPIVMVSSATYEGAQLTLDSLEAGADDFISKPVKLRDFSESIEFFERELIPRLRSLAKPLISEIQGVKPPEDEITTSPSTGICKPEAIIVGSSTGGPVALNYFFEQLGLLPHVPIFVVQHMPPIFTENFARRLNDNCAMRFKECEDGEIARPGVVYIAKGGLHMFLEKQGHDVVIRTSDGAMENSCRPAADVLFRSAVNVYGGNLLGLIFTGMGQDGCLGLQLLKDRGGIVLAQDEATSVVWGMPGAVARAGIANKILPLDEMAQVVVEQMKE